MRMAPFLTLILALSLCALSPSANAGLLDLLFPKVPTEKENLARLSVEETEFLLEQLRGTGGDLAGQTMLEFLSHAKRAGALRLPVTVGAVGASTTDAEFGSVDGSYRENGAIPKTSLALSTHSQKTPDGRFLVMVHVVLPYTVDYLGYAGTEINGTIIILKDGRTRIELNTEVRKAEMIGNRLLQHGQKLIAEYKPGEPSPMTWADVSFLIEASGVTYVSPTRKSARALEYAPANCESLFRPL